MAGTLRGSIWALVLGGTGLSVVSLVSEQPAGNTPPQLPQVSAPLAATAGQIDIDTQTTAPAVNRELAVNTPRVSAPEAEIAAPAADTEPAVPPQTLQLETALEMPADIGSSTVVTTLEEPALETVSAAPPQIPEVDGDAVIATQPTPPAPDLGETDGPVVAGIAEDALIIPVPEVAPAPAAPVVVQSDAAPIEVIEPAAPPVAEPPQIVEIAEPAIIPEPEILVQAEPQEEPVVEVQAPAPVTVSRAPDAQIAPEIAPVPPAPEAPREIRVNRLGVSADDDVETSQTDPLDDAETAAPVMALQRYGAAFENPDDVAMLSVLLVDDGQNGDLVAQVAGLGMPVTVVIHALAPNARDLMADYRAAGIEVAVEASLPAGAVPTDIEVAFEAVFGMLPEAAILFADGSGILRNNRAATAQVMQILIADGRGLVTAQRGLGSAEGAARDAGVPVASIMRELDGAGEDESSIVRGLDQAALRARQTGNVVLLGAAQETTLSALATWAQTVNQSQLALAPVSAVLLDGMP